MVVMVFPATAEMGVTQARIGDPLLWTVQAPQSDMPHPNLVPVIPNVSRKTQRRGMAAGTSTDCGLPLRVNFTAGIRKLPLSSGWRSAARIGPSIPADGGAPGHVVRGGRLEQKFGHPAGVQLRAMGLDRITRNPAVMGGKPCVRGMRVTVGTIVGLVASSHTTAEILAAYPYLEEEDIRQALAYAAWRVEEFEVPLPAA